MPNDAIPEYLPRRTTLTRRRLLLLALLLAFAFAAYKMPIPEPTVKSINPVSLGQ